MLLTLLQLSYFEILDFLFRHYLVHLSELKF